MAQRDVSSFKTTKNARYSDNSSGEVSAEDSRDMFEDTADSFLNLIDHESRILRTSDVTLSQADILNLHDTPIQLAPAPGVNKVILPMGFTVKMTFGTSAYDGGSGNLLVHWGVDGSNIAASALEDIVEVTADSFSWSRFQSTGQSGSPSSFFNKGLFLKYSLANPTGGDGTLRVKLLYQIVDFL